MKVTQFKANRQYLTAKVLEPGNYTIDTVEQEQINEEKVLVLGLKEEERYLKLTPHQVSRVARAFGEDSDAWNGKTVHLQRNEGKGKGIDLTIPEDTHA